MNYKSYLEIIYVSCETEMFCCSNDFLCLKWHVFLFHVKHWFGNELCENRKNFLVMSIKNIKANG